MTTGVYCFGCLLFELGFNLEKNLIYYKYYLIYGTLKYAPKSIILQL
jgi:hypothetical protein